MADETGWMLEKQDKGNNWFLGVVDGTLGWTIDPNKGLRLSRRADAEAIAVLCDDVERISEHLWPDMTVSTPQPETTDSLMEFFIASGCDIDRMTCARLLLRINYGQPLLSEAPLPAQGEPSTASGPTLGTCDTQPAFTHPHAEYCKNWRPVAGQTVEKQVARDYSCTICGIGMPQPCEHVRRTEAALAAQSAQPISTQDETAEQFDLELAKRCKQWLDDHVLVALPGLMALFVDKERKAYASSRLSAALKWHDEERTRAVMLLAAAEKELERLREATNELIYCVGKIAEQEGQEWRVAHPELIDAYSAATLAALGEAQKG